MKKVALVLLAVASIALGLWFGLQAPTRQSAPNSLAAVGGDFTLASESGPVSLHDFRGKVVAIYFGYTRCPDVCITSLSKLAAALKGMSLQERERIQPIFISVDPERDTPAIAQQYASFFYPDAIGLSGTPEEIAEIARRYLVIYEKVELEGSAMAYSVDHSSVIYVVGPDGAMRALVQHADDAKVLAQQLRAALPDQES